MSIFIPFQYYIVSKTSIPCKKRKWGASFCHPSHVILILTIFSSSSIFLLFCKIVLLINLYECSVFYLFCLFYLKGIVAMNLRSILFCMFYWFCLFCESHIIDCSNSILSILASSILEYHLQ